MTEGDGENYIPSGDKNMHLTADRSHEEHKKCH